MSVDIEADPETITDTETSDISSFVSNFEVDSSVTFSIQSGGGSLGSILANSCVYTPPDVAIDTDVVIRSTSDEDPTKYAEVTITVTDTP